jgi:RNA polymerase sigma-70 factor, ECF subfamily
MLRRPCLAPLEDEVRPRGSGAPAAGWAASAQQAEEALLKALRRGDEAAFLTLVERFHQPMIRMAQMYVSSAAAAEEVAQEAWLGVLEGLNRFEGRSSLKAWVFSILANCAKTRGVRDQRSVPFSALGPEDDEASVEPERFLDQGHPRWPGHWSEPPQAWGEQRLLTQETVVQIARLMEDLPPMQRAVMTMRDVEDLGAEETCRILAISEANQRVLLHRARSKVRKAMERYMRDSEAKP